MTKNKPLTNVAPEDVQKVVSAQNRVLRAYKRLGSWCAVGLLLDVPLSYAWDLANHGTVPKNPNYRIRLFLPRVLPSERSAKLIRSLRVPVWKMKDVPDITRETYFKVIRSQNNKRRK